MRRTLHIDFIKMMICLGFCIMGATLFSSTSIASVAFYLSFVVLVCKFVTSMQKNDQVLIMLFIIIILAFTNVITNMWLNDGGLSFEYMKKYIMFITTLVFMYVISVIPATMRTFRFVTMTSIMIGLLFVVAYFGLGIRTKVGITTQHLTMNFSNPNLLGMWLLLVVMYTVLAQFSIKGWLKHILLAGESLALLYLVYLTGSRTAEICIVVFMVLVLFNEMFFCRRRINKWILILVLVFPLVFAFIYLELFEWIFDIFAFMDAPGKRIDSRYETWQAALYYFKKHTMIGSYYEASGGTGAFQMHNTLLDTLCSYGSVVTILMLTYIYAILQRFIRNIKNARQFMCILCFFIVWFLGTTEAAMFSGGQGIYIFGCLFLLLARCNEEHNAKTTL